MNPTFRDRLEAVLRDLNTEISQLQTAREDLERIIGGLEDSQVPPDVPGYTGTHAGGENPAGTDPTFDG